MKDLCIVQCLALASHTTNCAACHVFCRLRGKRLPMVQCIGVHSELWLDCAWTGANSKCASHLKVRRKFCWRRRKLYALFYLTAVDWVWLLDTYRWRIKKIISCLAINAWRTVFWYYHRLVWSNTKLRTCSPHVYFIQGSCWL